MSEWALLPLRLFFGGTFLYAGLQKLANPNFFRATSPFSIQNQLRASARISPVGGMLVPLEHVAIPIGILISLGEIAVGVGTLLGLWGRIAAIGGAIISFSLFLTVSFHTSPYFVGADIGFFFGWMPLILAGSGTRLSLDAHVAQRAARESHLPSPELVVLPFAQVLTMCGHYQHGHCSAQDGLSCGPARCPVLEGPRPSIVERGNIDEVDRRTVVLGASRAAMVAGATVVGVGVIAGTGRFLSSTKGAGTGKVLAPPTTTPGTSGSTTSGTDIGASSQVPVHSSATFTVPSSGDPGIVICPQQGQYVAYDAVCPHAGCTVGYFASANLIACPCHGSEFDVETGDVVQGPATRGLTKFDVTVGTNGDLYIS